MKATIEQVNRTSAHLITLSSSETKIRGCNTGGVAASKTTSTRCNCAICVALLLACAQHSLGDPTPRVYNVRDYGALGNGVQDDTLSIQNTYSNAAAAGVG